MNSPFQPRFDELPEIIPVFPLAGALLLPKGRLPLNVFERRYLALVEDALGAGRMFGMIQPDPRDDGGDSLYRVGCLGRLTSFSETDDGRYLIALTGVIRFVSTHEESSRRGYRRVRANYADFGADLAETDEGSVGLDRPELLAALRAYFSTRGFDANWEAIDAMPDDALIVTLSMVCPFDPVSKQALLEARTLSDRADTLLALLRIAAHEDDSDERPSSRARAS